MAKLESISVTHFIEGVIIKKEDKTWAQDNNFDLHTVHEDGKKFFAHYSLSSDKNVVHQLKMQIVSNKKLCCENVSTSI